LSRLHTTQPKFVAEADDFSSWIKVTDLAALVDIISKSLTDGDLLKTANWFYCYEKAK
jgi:hypothetical protein